MLSISFGGDEMDAIDITELIGELPCVLGEMFSVPLSRLAILMAFSRSLLSRRDRSRMLSSFDRVGDLGTGVSTFRTDSRIVRLAGVEAADGGFWGLEGVVTGVLG